LNPFEFTRGARAQLDLWNTIKCTTILAVAWIAIKALPSMFRSVARRFEFPTNVQLSQLTVCDIRSLPVLLSQ
jgi:hypothetical protein